MAEWIYLPSMKSQKIPSKLYDIAIIDSTPDEEELDYIEKTVNPYTLFITSRVELRGKFIGLYTRRFGKRIEESELGEFLLKDIELFFSNGYGEKFRFKNLAVSSNYKGSVKYTGNNKLILNGDYGERLGQIAFWRNNIPVKKKQLIDLWLEYDKDPGVEIALQVTMFATGSISRVLKKWEFSEEELEEVVYIENNIANGNIFISLLAKGSGRLEIIALNDRYSRGKYGYFIPGGERHVTSSKEEAFFFFDPGDMKPPLNIYFSGYKTMQSFEGYYFIKKMGCPFLLITEPRIEGGSFYMGDEEYESMIVSSIKGYIKKLRFTEKDVIMSGLSMGTYGAMYYGCDIRPYAVIIGKPLASIGNVALNERLYRPGGFPTSLDVLMKIEGSCDDEAIERLNRKFWDKFEAADWSHTRFVISYMVEDDYDLTAYRDILSHLDDTGVEVYGKGLHGRHNDNTRGIVSWFSSQYKKIIDEDFGRGISQG